MVGPTIFVGFHTPRPPSPRTRRTATGRPSTIPGCPAGFVDCGSCFCTQDTNCARCEGLPPSRPPSGGNNTGVPSRVVGCPAGFVDCGRCLCTPPGNCLSCGAWPPGPPTLPPPELENETENDTNETGSNGTEPHIVWTPSTVPYCPSGFVDCGSCFCVSMETCPYCPGAWSPAPPPAVPSPSRVPGCPANYYDCGTCQCVPHSTCQWCPGVTPLPGPSPPPGPPTNPVVPVPSRVPGCPANYYDCGTCQCVPHSTCQWCPGVTPLPGPSPPPGPPTNPVVPVPSRVPGCPANYYDCGTCQCVPHSTCQWCPGVTPLPGPSPAPGPPTNPVVPVPSRVPGCPANYYDCGTCQCVPHSTCQWCPGVTPLPGPSPAPGPPTNPVVPVPSRVPGCPVGYVDCGTCVCVPRGTCQWCPGVSFIGNSSDESNRRL